MLLETPAQILRNPIRVILPESQETVLVCVDNIVRVGEDIQFNEYRQKIETLRDPLIAEGVVRWAGPYQPEQIGRRMEEVDWVVVPSVWWENSPMVIQEAFVHGRPLVVSDIGGMAEKVTDGVDGLHVSVSSTLAWSDVLLRLAGDDEEWRRLASGIRRPLGYDEATREALTAFAAWKECAAV